jgi:hypothetical protein
MARSVRGRGSTYAESTKLLIIRAVLGQPGRTGRQIAESLGLDRSRVNSFLYGEGIRRFGLVNSNWRWFPGKMRENWVPSSPPSTPAYREDRLDEMKESVCSILSRMSITNATLKIRTLSLTLVELAFGEDEYSSLDERLQAELIIRKKSLEAASKEVQVIRRGPNIGLWVVIIVLGVWVLTLLSNQKPADYPSDLQREGEVQPALPEK